MGGDHNPVIGSGMGAKESKGQDSELLPSEIYTDSARIVVQRCPENGEVSWSFVTRSKFKDQTALNTDLMTFLFELQEKTLPFLPGKHLDVFTRHTRGKQRYHGHPNYWGRGPWRDWVWVDWGAEGKFPSHIWCFVDLKGLKMGQCRIIHGGISVKAGTYAVVESSKFSMDDSADSILMPLLKEADGDSDGNVQKRYFYLANTDAFIKPCTVIPDIGGPFNRYFLVRPRNQWKDLFIEWLKDVHKFDDMT